MRNAWRIAALALVMGTFLMAYAKAPAGSAKQPAAQAGSAANLETVLKLMDETAAKFKTVETDFYWDQYSMVVDDHDTQSGTIYFRRQGKDIEMAANIQKHNGQTDLKYVLFAGGKVQVYQPRIAQVTVYSAGKNKAEFESFLVLGFGGSGHELEKSFSLKYAGRENVDGVNAYKLELTPKSQKMRSMFQRITLWIDPQRGVSVQQRFDEKANGSGDYRLAKYTNIKLNQKIPDSTFKLKTSGKVTYITPQG